MRRTLLLITTLVGLSRASLEAQTCRGLAPLPAGQLQASGTGKLTSGSHTLAAGVVYDLPGRAFGGVGLGSTAVEALGKSTVDLEAALGYQIDLGSGGRFQLCPIAETSVQLGPNNAFDSGVKRSMLGAAIGFTAGTSLRLRPLFSLVPAIGLTIGHRTLHAESGAGAQLFRIAESYGTARLYTGLVLQEILSIRPSVEIPLGGDGSAFAVGLTLSYHFGGRLAAEPEAASAVP